MAEPVSSLTVPKGPSTCVCGTQEMHVHTTKILWANHDLENFPIWRARLQWNWYESLKEEGKNTICNDEIANLRLTIPSISTMAEPIPNPTVSKGPSTYKGVNHHRKVQYSSATYKGDNRYHPDFEDESPIESSTNSADADATLLPTPIPCSQSNSKLETTKWKLSDPLISSADVLKLGQISYHTLPRSLDAEDTISNTTEPKAPPATEPSAKEPSATELPATEASATEPSATEPLATKPRFSNSIKPSSQALKG
ncbi:MAG: hypothetical protein Q9203_002538 [Teloschistes exilis]